MSILVHINDIYIPTKQEGQLRQRKIDEPSVIGNALSIQKFGLNNIFSVSKGNPEITSKPYEIKDGSGRYHAMLLIYLIATKAMIDGKPMFPEGVRSEDGELIDGTVNGKVFDGNLEVTFDDRIISTAERLAVQITTNYNMKATAAKEGIDAFVEIMHQNPEMTTEDLASYIGMSVGHVKRILKTVKLPGVARDALTTGELSLINAVTLSSLGKVDDLVFNSMFEDAKTLSQRDFANKLAVFKSNENERKQKEAADKTGIATPKKDREFCPIAKLRTKDEIFDYLRAVRAMYDELQADESANPGDLAVAKAKYDAVAYCCGLDEESIAEQKAQYDKNLADAAKNKEAKAEERARLNNLAQFYKLVKSGAMKENEVPKTFKKDFEDYSAKQKEKEAAELAEAEAAERAEAAQSETAEA